MCFASTFPLNEVIDTTAQRQSKLVWQSSERNHLLYSNNSLFILEIRIAPGKRKRGETHFTAIFRSEMGLVPISAWDCMPLASAVTATATKLPVRFFQRYHCKLSQGECELLAFSIVGSRGCESSQAKCCQAELSGARISKGECCKAVLWASCSSMCLSGQHQSIPDGLKRATAIWKEV